MTAMPAHQTSLPTVARTDSKSEGWWDLADAAEQMGKSAGHLRRHCKAWVAQGKARLVAQTGSRPRWQVRNLPGLTDDALTTPVTAAPGGHLRLAGESLRGMSEDARRQVLERKQLLDQWDEAIAQGIQAGRNREDSTAAFVVQSGVTRATLYRWQAGWRARGFAGLLDQRRASRSTDLEEDPFFAEVRRVWLRLGKPKKTVAYEIARLTAQEAGWPIPSYRTVSRRLSKIEKSVQVKMREGDKAFTDQCEPSLQRDYSQLAANEIWVGDHHVFDVWVKVGEKIDRRTGEVTPIHRRPWFTAFEDMATRKIVGWIIRAADPDTDAILAALVDGFRRHGVPESVYCDNGKDFDAAALTGITKAQRRKTKKGTRRIEFDRERIGGVYRSLGIRHMRAKPYRPQSKPIERFFRTYEERAGRLWPTYCGSNPEQRPQGLQKRISSGKAPTFAQFVEHFEGWLEADYHGRIHTGDSMDCTPNQAWADKLVVRRDAPEELLDVITQKRIGPVAVTKLGVRHQKIYYGQSVDAICRLIGQKVWLRINPDRIGLVSVWDQRDQFVCMAPANVKIPANASSQDLRVAIKEQRRQRRKMLEGAQAQRDLKESLPDRLVRAAQARAKAQETEMDREANGGAAVIQPVFSPLQGQIAAYKQEEQRVLNKAVGDGTDHRRFVGGDGSEEHGRVKFVYHSRHEEEDADVPAAFEGFRYVRPQEQEDEQ